MRALEQCLVAERMLEAGTGFLLGAGRGDEMKIPELVVVIVRHFLMTWSVLMHFFGHLAVPKHFADRSDGEDLYGKNGQEQYGQGLSHVYGKDRGNEGYKIASGG